jgi:hypothetical protein
MPFPNFIIGGPPKCGTTSIFEWLALHPEACAASTKETYHFFSRSEEKSGEIEAFSDAHVRDYQRYFDNCTGRKIVFEATPSYIYSRSAIEAFRKLNSEMKFLFIFRDPAERLYSEYAFHRYKTKRISGNFRKYTTDQMLEGGNYDHYLDQWATAFTNDQIALLHFTDLTEKPNDTMMALCRFLLIDPTFYQGKQLDAKNRTLQLRSRGIHTYLLKVARLFPAGFSKAVSPIYYMLNSSQAPDKSEDDKRRIEELKVHYEPQVAAFMQKYGSLFLSIDQKVS